MTLQTLIRECSRRQGDERSPALLNATGEFLRHAAKDGGLISAAVTELARLPPNGAAWLALTFGTAVEEGGDVELSIDGLSSLLDVWCGLLPTNEDEHADAPALTPSQTEVVAALPSLCQALVAHLARAPARREKLGRDRELIERVRAAGAWSYGASWVRQALEKTSGELLVLHPPSRRGLRLTYSNVSNCFHLFSLLQTAIGERLPGGQRPDPLIAGVARDAMEGNVTDTAWWHYADALTNKPRIGATIWGEGLVSQIPCVDGERIILLWPPLLGSRSWDSSFFHPHLVALPSDVVFAAELTGPECSALFTRLRLDDQAL